MRKAPAKRTRADYKVGWGRPPKSTRWRQGQSGNPKGRPRASKNQSTILKEALRQKLQVVERGRTRTISALEGIVRRAVSSALKGDLNAVKFLLQMEAELSPDTTTAEKLPSDMPADSIMETYLRMVRQVR